MSAEPLDDPELLSIISSALEMRDEGLEPPIEQLCGHRPDLVAAVREAIKLVGDLPSMQVRASARDPHHAQVLRERYRLDTRIGSGAMGVVYRAQDLELQRPVAVKILRSEALTAEEAEQRFVREAELLAAIRHPSVITIHDRGETERGEQFLVTELLEGSSLADLLDEGRKRENAHELEGTAWIADELGCEALPESSYLRTVVRWAADLAGGLNTAHEAGVIHRDVKPSNVFIDRAGKPLLLDFGIASSSSHVTLMRDSGALGTPAYMPPEALNPDVEPRPSLDVYGLTATLYHMLVCRAPYHGSPSQVIVTLATKEPPPAFKMRPGLPRDLQAILDKGMARRVSERYATAFELESDLRSFLDYRPVSARPISAVGRVWRRLRRSTAFFAAASVALVAIALAVGSNWSAKRNVARQNQFMDVWEHVPGGVGLWQPVITRKIVGAEERGMIEDLLNRAVSLSSHPIPARSIRAAFRADQGDRVGAAEDMAKTARVIGTSYAYALADRYRDLSIEGAGASKLDLEDLPEPSTAMDSYLAAYHAIRFPAQGGGIGTARAHLEVSGLEAHAPSIELLISLIEYENLKLPADERLPRQFENYERAVRLEELWGRRTAATAKLVGVALIAREHYRDAIAPLQDGVELCPLSYGLRQNLGIAERRVRAGQAALEHLREAARLRPTLVDPRKTLARVHLARGELALAREVTAQTPFGKSKASRRTRLKLEGDIECAHAIELHLEGSREASLAAAELALEKYAGAIECDEPDEFPQWGICTALLAGDEESIFGYVAQLMLEEPFHWRRLGTLLNWMPQDLDANQTSDIRSYLRLLKAALAERGD